MAQKIVDAHRTSNSSFLAYALEALFTSSGPLYMYTALIRFDDIHCKSRTANAVSLPVTIASTLHVLPMRQVALNPNVPGPESMPAGAAMTDVTPAPPPVATPAPAGAAGVPASGGGQRRMAATVAAGPAYTGGEKLINAQSPTLAVVQGPGQDPLTELENLLRHTTLSDVDRTRTAAVAAVSGVADAAHDASGMRSAALREWLVRMPLLEGGTLADRVGLPSGGAPTVAGAADKAAAPQSIAGKLLQAFVNGIPGPLGRRLQVATAGERLIFSVL